MGDLWPSLGLRGARGGGGGGTLIKEDEEENPPLSSPPPPPFVTYPPEEERKKERRLKRGEVITLCASRACRGEAISCPNQSSCMYCTSTPCVYYHVQK